VRLLSSAQGQHSGTGRTFEVARARVLLLSSAQGQHSGTGRTFEVARVRVLLLSSAQGQHSGTGRTFEVARARVLLLSSAQGQHSGTGRTLFVTLSEEEASSAHGQHSGTGRTWGEASFAQAIGRRKTAISNVFFMMMTLSFCRFGSVTRLTDGSRNLTRYRYGAKCGV
jgi:hypothetical protein